MKKVLLLAGLLALGGCVYLPVGYTSIKEINEAPANFDGKEVKVKGTVKDLTKIPFLDVKQYVLDDGTGEILVITEGTLPAERETVVVRGKVESPVIVGGQALGLHLKEIERVRGF